MSSQTTSSNQIIGLSPEHNGFQPQLNLIYGTGNGNGYFGPGWSLSIPGVMRKTSKGIPCYRDNNNELKNRDTFVLSGVENLVPIEDLSLDPLKATRFGPAPKGYSQDRLSQRSQRWNQ